MSVVEDLEGKVDKVRVRLDAAVDELRHFAELKAGLEKTDRTLAETGRALSNIIQVMEAYAGELEGAAGGLADVVAAFRSSELVGAVDRFERIEAQCTALPSEFSQFVDQGFNRQSSRIDAQIAELKSSIANVESSSSKNIKTMSSRNTTFQVFISVMSILNLVLMIVLLLKR